MVFLWTKAIYYYYFSVKMKLDSWNNIFNYNIIIICKKKVVILYQFLP